MLVVMLAAIVVAGADRAPDVLVLAAVLIAVVQGVGLVFARAECYRDTSSVAFVRAIAYVDDPAQPFASAAATFALSTRGRAITEDDVRKGLKP